jgi:hypothetical protein
VKNESCAFFLNLAQWKVAEIILIFKPRKSNELTSYPPTSYPLHLKVLLKRLLPMLENNGLIPNHQFSFRQRHSTIEQTHQIVQVIELLKTSNTVQHFRHLSSLQQSMA